MTAHHFLLAFKRTVLFAAASCLFSVISAQQRPTGDSGEAASFAVPQKRDGFTHHPEANPSRDDLTENNMLRSRSWSLTADTFRTAYRPGRNPNFQYSRHAPGILSLRSVRKAGIRTTPTGSLTTCELEASVDHNHCTTRQFQHMCFWHNGVWFAFYSDGTDFVYQTSADRGNTWQRAPRAVAPAPNGSTGFDVLKVGETVYISHALYPLGRYDVNAPYARDPARHGEYTAEGRVKKGRIEGRSITWLMDVNPGFIPDYGTI